MFARYSPTSFRQQQELMDARLRIDRILSAYIQERRPGEHPEGWPFRLIRPDFEVSWHATYQQAAAAFWEAAFSRAEIDGAIAGGIPDAIS